MNLEKLQYTVSIGVSSYPEDGSSKISQLVSNADKAMYQAKEQGRDQAIGYKK